MREVIRLIQDIRSFLSGAAGSPPAEALAPQYIRWREEAARRLEACAAMLEKGNEYQVLQLAESDPPLMDLVAELAFSDEPRWIDYCREHQLPVPARLDSRTIQALNGIYSKGISSNSELYRDYRSAVTSRDDDKAFRIMRSIARLNPGDATALAELGRLKGKKLTKLTEELKDAIARQDHDTVIVIVDEMEELADEDKLFRNETYVLGAEIRRTILREQGVREAEALLIQADKDKATRNWKSVSAAAARIRELDKERGLNLSSEQQSKLSAIERFVEAERADVAVQMDFEKALSALSALADTIDARLLTAATLSLEEAQKLESTFATFWKRVERFQRPVPPGELARLQGIGASIQREASRRRGRKKAGKMVMAALILAILCLGAWTGYVAWRAYDYLGQLQDLRSRKQAAAAAKLVQEIPASAPWGATSIPALLVALEEVRQWAKGEADHLQITERQLTDLEKEAAGGFGAVSPASLHSKLKEAEENVRNLATDMGAAPKDRLSELQNKADQHFAALKHAIVERAQKHLEDWMALFKTLDFDKPSSEMATTLETIGRVNQELAKMRQAETPDVSLPADLDASARKLETDTAGFAKELAQLAQARQSMSEASSLDAYKAALMAFSQVRFKEKETATPILANFPNPDWIGAALFFNGNLESWENAKRDAKGFKFHPEDVGGTELRRLLALRDDPELITSPAGKKLLTAIQFSSLFNSAGENYTGTLLERLDAIIRLEEGDPIIKAYLAGNLYVIIKMRPYQWGLHYCPRLIQDMEEVRSILGSRTLRSVDWNDKKLREKIAPALKSLFDRIAKGSPYQEEARTYYHFVSQVSGGEIAYAGFVDDKHALRLRTGAAPAQQLWGMPENGNSPVALQPGSQSPEETGPDRVKAWSPLFRLPVNVQLVPLKR